MKRQELTTTASMMPRGDFPFIEKLPRHAASGQKKLPASRWGPKLLRRRLSICGRTRSASERGRRKPGHHRYHRRRAGASFKLSERRSAAPITVEKVS